MAIGSPFGRIARGTTTVDTKPEPDQKPNRTGASALSLGTQLAAGMIFFAGVGFYVDRRRGGGIAFTLAGMFAGLGYGAYEVWKVVREINREAQRSDDVQPK